MDEYVKGQIYGWNGGECTVHPKTVVQVWLRSGGVKAREHLSRVKQLPCVICRKHGPSDAHHVFCGRFGSSKASDFEVIPLCKAHHQEGPDAIHNCKASWVEKYGEDHKYLPLVDQWLRSI